MSEDFSYDGLVNDVYENVQAAGQAQPVQPETNAASQQMQPVQEKTRRVSPYVMEAQEFITGSRSDLSVKAFQAYCGSLTNNLIMGTLKRENPRQVLDNDPLINADLSNTECRGLQANVPFFKAVCARTILTCRKEVRGLNQDFRDKCQADPLNEEVFRKERNEKTRAKLSYVSFYAVREGLMKGRSKEEAIFLKPTRETQHFCKAEGVRYDYNSKLFVAPQSALKNLDSTLVDSGVKVYASLKDYYHEGGSIALSPELARQVIGPEGKQLVGMKQAFENYRKSVIYGVAGVQDQSQSQTQSQAQGHGRR